MGAAKALLPVDGSTLGQRLADLLVALAAPVLEVGPGLTRLDGVTDGEPGGGPLAAIATGWAALAPRPPAVVVLACDLPRLSHAFLVRLIAAAGEGAIVPDVAGRLQPLCARYPAATLDLARPLVNDGARSMEALLNAAPFTVLPAGRWARALVDVDTPEDLDRLGLPRPAAEATKP